MFTTQGFQTAETDGANACHVHLESDEAWGVVFVSEKRAGSEDLVDVLQALLLSHACSKKATK
jgi:hypothetical protein